MSTITKTVRVLDVDLTDEDDSLIYFVATDEDTDHVTTEIMVSVEDWRALGSPSKVTVTIEPGDRLNPPSDGPHSRACGLRCAGHGASCSVDCPTCGRER